MWDAEPLVIVGANMAGMSAARALAGKACLQVFDAHRSVEWLPNIHELVSGSKRPQNLRLARAPLLHRMGHEFRVARLTRVDWRRHRLEFEDGREVLYSRLLLALGGDHNTFGVPGARDHAMSFKSVADCQRIGVRLAQLASQAQMRVVLVGAGVEGVEALGEILRRCGHLPHLHLTVVDRAERLLSALPSSVDARLREHCSAMPVSFELGRKVAEVAHNCVTLDNGTELPSDLVIWTGGVAPAGLIRESGLCDDSGFVPVNRQLQSSVSPTVLVAGDCVARVGERRVAKQAYHAMDMGKVAGHNLLADLQHREMKRFEAADKPLLVTFGNQDTFLAWGDQVYASPSLRVLKEAVYQLGVAQLDGRRPARRIAGLARRLLDMGVDEGINFLRAPSLMGALRLRRLG